MNNIKTNKYPTNVAKMTGPLPYTEAIDFINNDIKANIDRTNPNLWTLDPNEQQRPVQIYYYKNYNYRIYGVEYGKFEFQKK